MPYQDTLGTMPRTLIYYSVTVFIRGLFSLQRQKWIIQKLEQVTQSNVNLLGC